MKNPLYCTYYLNKSDKKHSILSYTATPLIDTHCAEEEYKEVINLFDDSDATGISNALRQMNNERVNKEVYDLTGRKVNNPQRKGLYVKDGKKVVVNK